MKAGWEEVALCDVCSFENGDRGKNYPGKKALVATGVAFINAGHIEDGDIDWVGMDHIPEQRFDLLGSGKIRRGDILFCLRGSLGKFGVVDRECKGAIASSLVIVRPNEAVVRDYVAHYFRSSIAADMISQYAGGAAQPNLSSKSLKAFRIPLPPLEEQQRIVAILDEAFEGLDRAKAHAEANLTNAQELFEGLIEFALEEAGGDSKTLQQLLDDGLITSHLDGNHGSRYPRKEEFVESGVPYISANCLQNGEVLFGRAKYLSNARADTITKGVARNRDVLFAHNATVGPVALLETQEQRVILSTSLTYYRCDEAKLIPEFLVFAMRGRGFRKQYEQVMRQATRSQVPITAQRKFSHRVPNLSEQRRIAQMGVELERRVKKALDVYTANASDLDQLRQSLLAKAFAGELI